MTRRSKRNAESCITSRIRLFWSIVKCAFTATAALKRLSLLIIERLGVQVVLATVVIISITLVLSFLFNPVLREMDQPVAPATVMASETRERFTS